MFNKPYWGLPGTYTNSRNNVAPIEFSSDKNKVINYLEFVLKKAYYSSVCHDTTMEFVKTFVHKVTISSMSKFFNNFGSLIAQLRKDISMREDIGADKSLPTLNKYRF